MFLILTSGEKLIVQDQVSRRIVYSSSFGLRAVSFFTRSDVRTHSLWFFIWPPGGKFILLILCLGGKLIIQDQVSGRVAYALVFGLRAVKFMLLILPSGGKLIMSERIAYLLYLARIANLVSLWSTLYCSAICSPDR
jgi:hypothetical protein